MKESQQFQGFKDIDVNCFNQFQYEKNKINLII
jgi:hypothetical protein